MKTLLWISLNLLCILVNDPETNDAELSQKLSEYFFGLALDSDISGLRRSLAGNPEFTSYRDPNLNENQSITGTMSSYKHINPASTRNQLIIQISPASNRENVLFRLSIDYKLNDLPLAMHDWEEIKKDFGPFFKESSEKIEIGFHQEEIETLSLKNGHGTVAIRIIKFNSLNHTISFEYTATRRAKVRQ
jgi:hypothetical protein